MITIEKNIPMPTPKRVGRQKGEIRKALEALEVGDSFVWPAGKAKSMSVITHVTKETGRRFSSRMLDGVIRVWRTA